MTQTLLPGFRRYMPVPPYERKPWEGRWWDRGFYGKIVPEPKDLRGTPLAVGPYKVLLRTDNVVIVYDQRKPLGEGAVYFVRGGRYRERLRLATREMVKRARKEKLI